MISAAVERSSRPFAEHWVDHLPSHLVHHGACCDQAKRWLVAMARSFDFLITEGQRLQGPRFLSERYEWGPSPWPLAWCDAVRRETIDCGVFAAFARTIFAAKGLEAFPGQIVQRFDGTATGHWRRRWREERAAFPWIGDEVVYHEVVVVRVAPGVAALYDPTDGAWMDPLDHGPGKILALRSEAPGGMAWGPYVLVSDQWSRLG